MALGIRQYYILWVWVCGLRYPAVLHTLSLSLWPCLSVSTTYSECVILALGTRQYYILWVRFCGLSYPSVLHTLSVNLWPYVPGISTNSVRVFVAFIFGSTIYSERVFVALCILQYYILWARLFGLYLSGSTIYSERVFVTLVIRQFYVLWMWICGPWYPAILHTLSLCLYPYLSGSTTDGWNRGNWKLCKLLKYSLRRNNSLFPLARYRETNFATGAVRDGYFSVSIVSYSSVSDNYSWSIPKCEWILIQAKPSQSSNWGQRPTRSGGRRPSVW